MFSRIALISIMAFVIWAPTHADVNITESSSELHNAFIGEAFDLETGDLIYREYHRVYQQENGTLSSKVEYVYADGQEKAVKYVDFSSGQLSPSFTIADAQFDYSEEVLMDDAGATISITGLDLDFTKRFEAEGKVPVVDAGFNEFIHSHLDELLAGKKKSFAFLSPTRADTVTLRARYDGTKDGLIRVVVEPKSFFIRILLSPIVLFYDKESFRLTAYEGLTNIRKDAKRNYEARIEYRYPGANQKILAFIDKEFFKKLCK